MPVETCSDSRCHGPVAAGSTPRYRASTSASNTSFLRSASCLKAVNSASMPGSSIAWPMPARRSRSAARPLCLPSTSWVPGKPTSSGPHDLVGAAVGDHAVLVDAGFVREGVVADDGLVARDAGADHAGEQARGAVESLGADAGLDAVAIRPRAHRHHHFLQRAVAGALADAGDGALDLARAGLDRGQAVGDRQPEVVVAMRADGDAGRCRARAGAGSG